MMSLINSTLLYSHIHKKLLLNRILNIQKLMTNLLGPICNLLFKKNLRMLWDWARTQDQGLCIPDIISVHLVWTVCVFCSMHQGRYYPVQDSTFSVQLSFFFHFSTILSFRLETWCILVYWVLIHWYKLIRVLVWALTSTVPNLYIIMVDGMHQYHISTSATWNAMCGKRSLWKMYIRNRYRNCRKHT